MDKLKWLLIPVKAFYSRSTYREAGHNWKGKGFLYLLCLLAACWLSETSVMQFRMIKLSRQNAPSLLNQLPNISIKEGTVYTNVPQPYYIKDTKTGSTFAIIDTTGTITASSNIDAKILLTKNQIIYKSNNNETRIHNLNFIANFYISKERVKIWLHWFLLAFLPLAFPLFTLVSFVWRIIQVLFYGAVGFAIVKIFKIKLDYKALVRISALAITPAIILSTIFGDLTSFKMPHPVLIFFGITIAYLVLGIYSCKEDYIVDKSEQIIP